MKQVIRRGGDMHEAFQNAGVFPNDFLSALQAGEISGRISEAMAVLAKEYEERTKVLFGVVAMLAGIGVLLVVAAMITFLIFNLFFQYLETINSLTQI